jgi:hypothetical protein
MSGSKFDQEKVDLHVLDPFFIEGTARVAQFGEQKYGRSNWMQGLTQTRILNAIKRHIAQIEKGEDIDEESGFHHAYHAAWGCQVLAYQHRNGQTHLDDRRWSESVRDADTRIGACEGISGHTMPSLHGSASAGVHLILGTENGLDMPIMQSEADEGEKKADPIRELQQMISEWADAVYPNRTVENALTKMMLHEIPELLHGKAMDPQEFADVAILLFDVAHLQGIDIAQAMRYKMQVNKQRNWQIDENTGLMSHVKEGEFAPTKIWDGFADLGVAAEKSAEKIAESMKKAGFNVRPYRRCKMVPTGFLTDARSAVLDQLTEQAVLMGDSLAYVGSETDKDGNLTINIMAVPEEIYKSESLPKPPEKPWEITIPDWAKTVEISDRIKLKRGSGAFGRVKHQSKCILIHKNIRHRSHLETYFCATIKDTVTEDEYNVPWSELKPWTN